MIETWSDLDFEGLNWHDNSIHSILFPSSDLMLKFDIDYILEWKLNSKTNLYEFVVAPASLVFNNVMDLNIRLEFGNSVELHINNISRINKRLTPNGKLYLWNYIIETDRGKITFESTGFTQKLDGAPQNSKSQRIR